MMSAALVEWAKINLQNKNVQLNRQYQQLSQLTIVIPTFCRQEYLLRQVVYWAFSDATIIIADGSPVPLVAQAMDLISEVPNVQYFSLIDSYINRIREACKRIKTPYAMCLADDDMFLMEGLCSAVDYLNQDNGIVVCMGQVIGIDYDDKKKRAHFFPYGDSLENYQVRHQNPVRRIQLGIDSVPPPFTRNAAYGSSEQRCSPIEARLTTASIPLQASLKVACCSISATHPSTPAGQARAVRLAARICTLPSSSK